MAKHTPLLIKPHLEPYVMYLAQNIQTFPPELDPGNTFIAITNNAVWCLSEFCVAFPEELK